MTTLRIVLAEDDGMIGMLLAEMLTAMGHDVCAVEATKDATVSAAARHRPDLIIADARLGQESGVSAIEEILRGGFVPHLFMSGNISAVRALRPDAVILEKPFDEGQLAHAIQRCLSNAATSLPVEPT